MDKCLKCDQDIDDYWTKQNIFVHPACDDILQMRNVTLRAKLIEIIKWADQNSPRSLQVAIGPSEMGEECDQRVARVLAGMPRVNFRPDPWAAIVGTSIHKWLEGAVNFYQANVEDPVTDLWTEMDVQITDLIPGHTDVYDPRTGDVIDYKSTGPDGITDMRKHGPPKRHKIQGHLYGYAHARAGRAVRDIVLVFVPRAGWLKDMYIWREPYDEKVAKDAIERVYRLALLGIELGVIQHPQRWAQIPTTPGKCWYCPFYVDRPAERLPDKQGCPGHSKGAVERTEQEKSKFKGLI